MRFVIQRVTESSVDVDGKTVGKIGRGLSVLAGISDEDQEETADRMIRKMTALRIFEDQAGKTNLSLADVGGGILLVPQFTLYADVRRGSRPSFTGAGKPAHASALFDYLCEACRRTVPVVECGIFGADMTVHITNDGPFTILLDSENLTKPGK